MQKLVVSITHSHSTNLICFSARGRSCTLVIVSVGVQPLFIRSHAVIGMHQCISQTAARLHALSNTSLLPVYYGAFRLQTQQITHTCKVRCQKKKKATYPTISIATQGRIIQPKAYQTTDFYYK